ncbi:AAA family ATPase [Paenibacillus lutimineralis]|uniref:NadR/Ttd14 AAA domain-containing protein n=1 Tax=Paenibacillus lutimineralis TaxID=2707005 RepID=A0A3Q9I983_9BACL|nr:AAA family ATPase [Paenibacillus lutimineralis]AZS15417.1 hypothetical protein EI981_13730 [Paenibacillus lutimineralis]
MDDFIIITGGPGAGKTTLLYEIQKNGYSFIPEVAREIIQTQVSSILVPLMRCLF